jgi:hypothetical protein
LAAKHIGQGLLEAGLDTKYQVDPPGFAEGFARERVSRKTGRKIMLPGKIADQEKLSLPDALLTSLKNRQQRAAYGQALQPVKTGLTQVKRPSCPNPDPATTSLAQENSGREIQGLCDATRYGHHVIPPFGDANTSIPIQDS